MKHPKKLYILCAAEAGERFGFYLFAALFILWLNEKLGWPEPAAMSLNGWYRFGVYLAPLFGGMLADNLLGYRRSIILGACLLGTGYWFLGHAGSPTYLYGTLGLLVLGNGLFKPNISTLVGNLYPQNDPRRDDAFSIFYMGINVGALLAPLVGEAVKERMGWAAAFQTAGAVMSLCLLATVLGYRALAVADQRSSVSAILDVPLGSEYEDPKEAPEVERRRITAILILCSIMTVFWLSFLQNENALVLWARDNTDRVINLPCPGAFLHWLGVRGYPAQPWTQPWEVPPTYFSSANPAFILLLTWPVTWFFGAYLRGKKKEPTTPAKICIGMLFTAAAYLIMVVAGISGGDGGRVSMWWLIICYFVITVAELLLSPIGLSLISSLSPRRMTARLMGVWFLGTAIGGLLAGKLGAWLWRSWPHSRFFAIFAVLSVLAFAVLLTQYRRLCAALGPAK